MEKFRLNEDSKISLSDTAGHLRVHHDVLYEFGYTPLSNPDKKSKSKKLSVYQWLVTKCSVNLLIAILWGTRSGQKNRRRKTGDIRYQRFRPCVLMSHCFWDDDELLEEIFCEIKCKYPGVLVRSQTKAELANYILEKKLEVLNSKLGFSTG